MMWLRACPRCSGDLYEDCDIHGPYVACLQCGLYLSDVEVQLLYALGTSPAPERERDKVVVA